MILPTTMPPASKNEARPGAERMQTMTQTEMAAIIIKNGFCCFAGLATLTACAAVLWWCAVEAVGIVRRMRS